MVDLEHLSDEYLMLSLRDSSESTFDFIFKKYYKALCVQANLYLDDVDLAQSVVQECFIKLWLKRAEAPTIKKLAAFLSTMVRNGCIDYLRKYKYQQKINAEIAQIEEHYEFESLINAKEFEEKLIVALSLLPQKSRIAFEYSRFERLSNKEIAEKMNISVKAVEALISRSLKILRAELSEFLPLLFIFLNNK